MNKKNLKLKQQDFNKIFKKKYETEKYTMIVYKDKMLRKLKTVKFIIKIFKITK